ncbi:hypothetical protein CAEBREN_10294 [Caenorhabditis brenneri]|uniref:Uncharacterized protein n=1 Tax=Caenorhabditis brenneri TaxID=135651 RepID=G0PE46_CAEBE|nr:hypothetical protein CAEBREN_10294 [Caenorhabditis brenneri]
MNSPTPRPSNSSMTVSCTAQISSIQEAPLFGSSTTKEKQNGVQKPGRSSSPVTFIRKFTNITSGKRKRS